MASDKEVGTWVLIIIIDWRYFIFLLDTLYGPCHGPYVDHGLVLIENNIIILVSGEGWGKVSIGTRCPGSGWERIRFEAAPDGLQCLGSRTVREKRRGPVTNRIWVDPSVTEGFRESFFWQLKSTTRWPTVPNTPFWSSFIERGLISKRNDESQRKEFPGVL